MTQCLKCQSDNVIAGKIYGGRGTAVFRPKSLRFWAFTIYGGPQFTDDAFACLDCGFVGGYTFVNDLREFVAKNCHPPKPDA